jgi:pimeloyl-ACP methyl ester carboxylesterase
MEKMKREWIEGPTAPSPEARIRTRLHSCVSGFAGLGLLAVSIFCSMDCVTYRYGERDLLLPQKEYGVSAAFHFEKYFFSTVDSIKIESWFLSREDAEMNLLFLPGNKLNLRHRIPAFNQIGRGLKANIFAVNYRGYGLSEGEPTIDGILKDGEAAIAFLNRNPEILRGFPLYLVGFSLGSFVALHIAADSSVKGIILLASMTSTDEIIHYGKRARIPFLLSPFVRVVLDPKLYLIDNISQVAHVQKPILFIHGELDSALPCEMSGTLYRICPSPKKKLVILKGATHFLCDDQPICRVVDEINRFVADEFRGGSGCSTPSPEPPIASGAREPARMPKP